MSESDPAKTSLEKARAVKDEARKVSQRLGKLAGIGITRIGEEYGLKINIEATNPEVEWPAEIQGVPVKVEVVGAIRKRAA